MADADLLDRIAAARTTSRDARAAARGRARQVGRDHRAAEVAGRDGPGNARRRSAEDPCAARSGDDGASPTARRRSRPPSSSASWRPRRSTCRCRRRTASRGTVHPVSQVMDELAEIFADLGFAVADGPEIEDDWYNFTALNMPENHPARAMHDTFYLEPRDGGRGAAACCAPTPRRCRSGRWRRTAPPIRIIAPGRVYRSDSDATHTPMFHQVEGLVIDAGITSATSSGRWRPSSRPSSSATTSCCGCGPCYFPFTEPSAEVDVGWSMEKGRRVVGGSEGWMEVLGSGMVHPQGDRQLRARSRRVAGLRLRLRHRPAGDAQIWHGRPARLLRRRYPLAEALRLPRARRADAVGRSGRMKFSLDWLKEHLETDASARRDRRQR